MSLQLSLPARLAACTLVCLTLASPARAADQGWHSLFDGQSLEGWKVSENPSSVQVEEGVIVLHGPRAHAFYVGPVHDHDFTNFELKVEAKTEPGSNAGIYFHTAYQETGWPEQGYEVQVNNSHKDFRRTGSLYAVQDVTEKLVDDGVWYSYHIKVDGQQVTIQINGQTVVEYTEPTPAAPPANMPGRKLSSGTFALQAHDPDSRVYIRNIEVKPLP